MATRAVVLLSGGLDSATTLAIARAEGYECHALSFDYGQRHVCELESAKKVAAALGAVQHQAPDRVVLLEGDQPTAEVLTREAWTQLERQLPAGITLERVAIRETPSCSSAISRPLT